MRGRAPEPARRAADLTLGGVGCLQPAQEAAARPLRPAAAGCRPPAALAVAAPAPVSPHFLPYFPFQISPPRRPAPLAQLAAKWEENGEIMDGRTVLEADEALLERTGCAPTVARRLVEAARANDFAFATQASAWACLGVHALCTRCWAECRVARAPVRSPLHLQHRRARCIWAAR